MSVSLTEHVHACPISDGVCHELCNHYPPIQPATRGTVNGIGQSLVAIGRSTGPLIGAPLFAWSEGNGKMCVFY